MFFSADDVGSGRNAFLHFYVSGLLGFRITISRASVEVAFDVFLQPAVKSWSSSLTQPFLRLHFFMRAQDRFGVNQPGHHPAGAAISGAAATVFHDAVMTPMDVIKQRLQLGYHKGMLDCMLTIRRTEGTQVCTRARFQERFGRS